MRFTKRRNRPHVASQKWWEVAREPIPPDDSVYTEIEVSPGEVLYPSLVVMDWQQYLDQIDMPARPEVRVAAASRLLFLTDRRIIIFAQSRDGAGHQAEIPLSDIMSVSLGAAPGEVTGMEAMIEIDFRDAVNGRTRRVSWTTLTKDAETFAEMLDEFRGGLADNSG